MRTSSASAPPSPSRAEHPTRVGATARSAVPAYQGILAYLTHSPCWGDCLRVAWALRSLRSEQQSLRRHGPPTSRAAWPFRRRMAKSPRGNSPPVLVCAMYRWISPPASFLGEIPRYSSQDRLSHHDVVSPSCEPLSGGRIRILPGSAVMTAPVSSSVPFDFRMISMTSACRRAGNPAIRRMPQ